MGTRLINLYLMNNIIADIALHRAVVVNVSDCKKMVQLVIENVMDIGNGFILCHP